MKNFARFGLGTDPTKIVGYVSTTTDRLGPITLQFENHSLSNGNTLLADSLAGQGSNSAYVVVKYFTPSSVNATTGAMEGTWTQLLAPFTIAPGGRKNVEAVVFAKKIGIFGSGNTAISLEVPHTHAAALRGGHIDVEPIGRQGWGFDAGVERAHMFPIPPA